MKVKRHCNSLLERFKAWTVADGNILLFGESFVETHVPVVSITAVRKLMNIAVRNIENAVDVAKNDELALNSDRSGVPLSVQKWVKDFFWAFIKINIFGTRF